METFEKTETLRLRERHIGEACQIFFASDPLKIVRAAGQYMYNEKGQEYLDCINNVCHVGHCHSEVVDAGYAQMKSLNTNSRFLHDNLVLLAQKLTATLPDKLKHVYMCNSGSEANDLAMRLARHHTKGTEFITMERAYHGHVMSAIDISPYKLNVQKDNVHTYPDHVHVALCPDPYRGKFRDTDHSPGSLSQKYAEDVKNIIENLSRKGKKVACYIAESLQSCGGQIVYPPGYLKQVYKYVHDAGGVCIADEVQVGFGRVGSHFWAFQTQDVEPDIVTMGKPMGNGHPVSAVITTQEISASFRQCGMTYFNTFGGNPVSCAISLAVLDVIKKEKLQENALLTGDYLMKQGRKLKNKFPIIGDVRGLGFFIGFDLVTDQTTRQPATEEASYVVRRMKEDHRILLSTDGPHDNVLKFKPPMCFSRDDCNRLLTCLELVLNTLQQKCPTSPGLMIKTPAVALKASL